VGPELTGAVRFRGEGVPGSKRQGGALAATKTLRGRRRHGGSSWMWRRQHREDEVEMKKQMEKLLETSGFCTKGPISLLSGDSLLHIALQICCWRWTYFSSFSFDCF
jgi:hypothetical protein